MSDWTIATLKEHVEKIIELNGEALRLQAAKYEEQLRSLRADHDRIEKEQAAYVSYSVLGAVVSLIIAIAAIWFNHR